MIRLARHFIFGNAEFLRGHAIEKFVRRHSALLSSAQNLCVWNCFSGSDDDEHNKSNDNNATERAALIYIYRCETQTLAAAKGRRYSERKYASVSVLHYAKIESIVFCHIFRSCFVSYDGDEYKRQPTCRTCEDKQQLDVDKYITLQKHPHSNVEICKAQ